MPISGVKEVKDLRLVYEGNGNAILTWSSDMPGGVMTVRKTIDSTSSCKFVDTNGKRETLRIPLDGIEGQLHQMKIVPDSGVEIKLFEGYVRFRTIGVFIDGSCGEIFETPPLSFAG